jgi:uncharacterized membrane protein YpjA
MNWDGAVTVCCILFGLWVVGLVIVMLDEKEEINQHHDNRMGSHYKISQQVLRDVREQYINGKK